MPNTTYVSDTIVPIDPRDLYATHDERFGAGGYRSELTLADRNNLSQTPLRLRLGMLVNILSGPEAGRIYRLDQITPTLEWTELTFGGCADATATCYTVTLQPHAGGDYVAEVPADVSDHATAALYLNGVLVGADLKLEDVGGGVMRLRFYVNTSLAGVFRAVVTERCEN